LNLHRGPGPLHHGDGDRLVAAGRDGGRDPRIAERRRIAVALQLEADATKQKCDKDINQADADYKAAHAAIIRCANTSATV